MGWLATLLGERQNGLYREGEAPADPKPSSAGASLSHPCLGQVNFSWENYSFLLRWRLARIF